MYNVYTLNRNCWMLPHLVYSWSCFSWFLPLLVQYFLWVIIFLSYLGVSESSASTMLAFRYLKFSYLLKLSTQEMQYLDHSGPERFSKKIKAQRCDAYFWRPNYMTIPKSVFRKFFDDIQAHLTPVSFERSILEKNGRK